MPAYRLFSVEEANALLPQLETFLLRITQKKEQMHRLHDELFMGELLHEAVQSRPAPAFPEKGNGHLDSGACEVDARVSDLEADLAQIRSLGCILRHLDAGWVEFPAERQGKMIYLCWKKGEPAIGFYRQMHAPFTERLPL